MRKGVYDLKKFLTAMLALMMMTLPITTYAEQDVGGTGPVAKELHAVATPEPTPEPTHPPREIHVGISHNGNDFYEGDAVTLTATLINYEGDEIIGVQWQYSEDGEAWHDISGATSLDYTFHIDYTNYRYYWRILVTRLQ